MIPISGTGCLQTTTRLFPHCELSAHLRFVAQTLAVKASLVLLVPCLLSIDQDLFLKEYLQEFAAKHTLVLFLKMEFHLFGQQLGFASATVGDL